MHVPCLCSGKCSDGIGLVLFERKNSIHNHLLYLSANPPRRFFCLYVLKNIFLIGGAVVYTVYNFCKESNLTHAKGPPYCMLYHKKYIDTADKNAL